MSKTGIILVSIFLICTLSMSIILEFYYHDQQWMWGFILGGYPISLNGIMNNDGFEGLLFLFGGYMINMCIIYGMGAILEKLCKVIIRNGKK